MLIIAFKAKPDNKLMFQLILRLYPLYMTRIVRKPTLMTRQTMFSTVTLIAYAYAEVKVHVYINIVFMFKHVAL